jgi:hypothetical protein
MAQKIGLFNQWFWGAWADRDAINRNADDLESIDGRVAGLTDTVARQAGEIVHLQAVVMALVEVLQTTKSLDDAELERAVKRTLEKLSPPPAEPARAGDPYRDGLAPGLEPPTPQEVQAASALMATAQRHHFAKDFAQARAVYQDVVTRYGNTKQAATARQQLENLRRA